MTDDKFTLSSKDFSKNCPLLLHKFWTEEEFCDVTLATEDGNVEAHKVVLGSCSPFFRRLFLRSPDKALVFLMGVKLAHLRSVMEYVYLGETEVRDADLVAFLDTGRNLMVDGLTEEVENVREIKDVENKRDAEQETMEMVDTSESKGKKSQKCVPLKALVYVE